MLLKKRKKQPDVLFILPETDTLVNSSLLP